MNPIAKLLGPFAAVAMTIPAVMLAERAEPQPAFAKPRIVRWSHGDKPIRLLPADKGFCFVSGMGGNFQGGGEGVRVFVDDGAWWVAGYSCQPSLWVEVTVMTTGQRPGSSADRRVFERD